MFEEIVSIAAAGVVCICCILRLNELKALRLEEITQQHVRLTIWRVLEALGLAIIAAGCVGSAGEWFLEGVDLNAETIVLSGAALFGLGVTQSLRGLAGAFHMSEPPGAAPAGRLRGYLAEEHEFAELERRFLGGEK